MRVSATLPDGRRCELDDGVLVPHREALAARGAVPPVRVVHAAPHVVMRGGYDRVPHSAARPADPAELGEWIDWAATGALRARLAAAGFGIAEAMDTAQRFAIGWPNAERLIAECGRARPAHGFVAGAGTDHLAELHDVGEWVAGALWQVERIRAAGGVPIVLPSAWLARELRGPDAYVAAYTALIDAAPGPLLLHWLGEMFAPALRGYFPGDSFRRVMAHAPDKVIGCKLSLLDARFELEVRRELAPRGQVVFTGDDFHFGELILGGDPAAPARAVPAVERTAELDGRPLPLGDFSHALLGVFDAIAEPASLALCALAHGDADRYRALIEPCEALGRHLFAAPTEHYKAGLAFLSWLNGWQDEPALPNHAERERTAGHYARAAELAARAGVLADAALAAERLGRWRG